MHIIYVSCILLLYSFTLQSQDNISIKLDDLTEFHLDSGALTHRDILLKTSNSTQKPRQQVFQIKAEYSGDDCNRSLTSFTVINAQFPLTWHELNEDKEIVNSQVNTPIENLKDQTWYVIEDSRSYKDTVFIALNKAVDFRNIYPNPAYEILNIDLSVSGEQNVYMGLYSLNGNIIQESSQFMTNNENNIKVDIGNISRGVYLFSISTNCISKTLKVVIF